MVGGKGVVAGCVRVWSNYASRSPWEIKGTRRASPKDGLVAIELSSLLVLVISAQLKRPLGAHGFPGGIAIKRRTRGRVLQYQQLDIGEYGKWLLS